LCAGFCFGAVGGCLLHPPPPPPPPGRLLTAASQVLRATWIRPHRSRLTSLLPSPDSPFLPPPQLESLRATWTRRRASCWPRASRGWWTMPTAWSQSSSTSREARSEAARLAGGASLLEPICLSYQLGLAGVRRLEAACGRAPASWSPSFSLGIADGWRRAEGGKPPAWRSGRWLRQAFFPSRFLARTAALRAARGGARVLVLAVDCTAQVLVCFSCRGGSAPPPRCSIAGAPMPRRPLIDRTASAPAACRWADPLGAAPACPPCGAAGIRRPTTATGLHQLGGQSLWPNAGQC
jgi:hypothetical protein